MHRVEAALGKDGWLLYLYSLSVLSSSDSSSSAVAVVVVAVDDDDEEGVLLLGIATLFKLSMPNKKTLAIETGIQNSGLGLLLIFTFFEGLGGMAIMAAFWGIWHIISGLLLASFWAAKATKSN